MRDKCNNCRFSQVVNLGCDGELMRACVYILTRYEKRPCPPGENCTVHQPRRGREWPVVRPLWP